MRGAAEIAREIDALVARGRAVRNAARDLSIRALHTDEMYWLEGDDRDRLNSLQVEWARSSRAEAIVRLERRHAKKGKP